MYFPTKPLSCSRDFFPFSCVKRARRAAFYEHFIVLPHHENSSSWRFPRNAIRGRRLLNFSTFRSTFSSPENSASHRGERFTLSDPSVIIEFQRPIQRESVRSSRECGKIILGRYAALLITGNPARIINGPFTRHSLPPISIRPRILFVPSALALTLNRMRTRSQCECRL